MACVDMACEASTNENAFQATQVKMWLSCLGNARRRVQGCGALDVRASHLDFTALPLAHFRVHSLSMLHARIRSPLILAAPL
jgi:hypothetical protein